MHPKKSTKTKNPSSDSLYSGLSNNGKACVRNGFEPGTEAYLQCMYLAAEQQRKRSQFFMGLGALMLGGGQTASPPAAPTIRNTRCRRNGLYVDCTQW